MSREAASIWLVIAAGSFLNAAEPSVLGDSRANARTGVAAGFVDASAEAWVDRRSGEGEHADSPFAARQEASEGPNWLLDAMRRETGEAPATLEELLREARRGGPRAGVVPARAKRPPERPMSNPFADYLASWMTPEDYALLQVRNERDASHESAGRVSTNTLRAQGSQDTNPFIAAQQVAQENGGKRATDTHPVAPRTASPEAAPGLPPAPAPAPAVVPVAPSVQEQPPSGWTPAADNDKKYFPQLNRF